MLDPSKALELASRLRTIPDFPRDEASVEATAEDFIDLCGDLSKDGAAEYRRIDWLVRKARREWDQWPGTKTLLELYRKTFDPPPPLGNEVKPTGPKPRIQCRVCDDLGFLRPGGRGSTEPYQWCECHAGINLHLDQPRWLDILNRVVEVAPPPPPIDLNPIHPATERELTPVEACPVCQAGTHRHRVLEWQQFHQEAT